MEELILGLLLEEARTIYDLKKIMNERFCMCYRDSLGSLRVCLNGLMDRKYIIFKEEIRNGRYHKFYHITASGRSFFMSWLTEEPAPIVCKNLDLPRIYFLPLLSVEKQVEILRFQIQQLKQQISALQLKSGLQAKDVTTEINPAISYELDALRFHLSWYRRCLRKLNKEKTTSTL